jgi:signal transduction histidine kinase/ActR/RegA family two-component response regulator
MKLRTQISWLLFLFGLVPLLVAFVINLPIIFDRIEGLYHEAHLQNLRAGFTDLDQHIARRNEMVRLLAKMPEPGMLLPDDEPGNARAVEVARLAYVDWVNQVLFDQLDITRILFLDEAGQVTLELKRNKPTGKLEPADGSTGYHNNKLVEAGLKMRLGSVMTGPIEFSENQQAASPNQLMQLGLAAPVFLYAPREKSGSVDEKRGVIIVYLDMGGLANAYRGIYWAHSDGRYLDTSAGGAPVAVNTAFEDFRGLEEIFKKGELDLWEFEGQQVLWVPLFDTVDTGPLWVGRSVDPSPITQLRHTIEGRVAIVAIGLLLVVFVVARLIALRTERLGHELTDGISQVLERDEAVAFSWQRPQELHELGNNLTRLAETHAEHNKALRDYADELEASNRYKSEFLANVSHELRTPLNSILLLSKMLAAGSNEKVSGEESRQARIIHSAGTDLKALIDNILDLSRVEARQMTLVAETVELEPLLNNILELMKPQFDEKHLELKLDVDASAPVTIVADSEKLRQILINFLSNAVKFTEQGCVTVRLKPGQDREGRAWPVTISVTDTGIGIPASKGEKVFEAFKQADGSTSRRFGGTGLGLTISRELAHLMGGRIELESKPGAGSTFTLMLPEEMLSMPEAGIQKPVEGKGDAEQVQPLPQADYHNARVLVVDDDVRNLLALTPLLEKWKLDVMAAGDGQEALETLATGGDFELVFIDIMMPGMDGYEVIRRLREQPRFSKLPIVALTAKAGTDDREHCLAAGADDCIVKPIEPLELKIKLDKYVAGIAAGETPGPGHG